MSTDSTVHDQPRHPSWLRGRLAKWPVLVYRLGLGSLIAGQVMVLTTRGRLTGRVRNTPLWYVREGDTVFCISGWGPSSDWSRNLKTDPRARVRIGRRTWQTRGVLVPDGEGLRRVLSQLRGKYRRLVPLLYHMDRISLVAFALGPGDDRVQGDTPGPARPVI